MIVQCEACVKRYWIDDAKIVKEHMMVNCPNCDAKIMLHRSQHQPDPTAKRQASAASDLIAATVPPAQLDSDWHTEQGLVEEDPQVGGMTIGKKLVYVFATFILVTGAVLAGVYMNYVPALMHEQVDLRTHSISSSFSTAIQQPLLIKNYLLVNQMAGTNAKLPGVAYVSVLNKKGVVVAGIFGESERFSPGFKQAVKEKGFPKEIVSKNPIPSGSKESAMDVSVDGHKIHDVAVLIGETGGEAHVGLFTEDVEKAVHKSLIPLMAMLVAIACLGSVSFFFVARTISTPIRSLTAAAEKISLGDIDLPIDVQGRGEIGELAASLERMRFSIKAAMNRMRRN